MQRAQQWVSGFFTKTPSAEELLAEQKRRDALAEQKIIEGTQSAVFLVQCAIAGTTVILFFSTQPMYYTLGAAALTLYTEILAKEICERTGYPKAAEHLATKYSPITRSFMTFKSVAYPIVVDGIITPNVARIREGFKASETLKK